MPARADVETPSRVPGGARPTALLRVPGKALPVAAAITVAIVLVALIGLFTVVPDSSSDQTSAADSTSSAGGRSSQVASTSASVAAERVPAVALSWSQDALPHNTSLLVEPQDAAAFRARGLSTVVPRSAAGHPIGFVVETQGLRDDASRYPAVARALRRSVPVAAFSTSSADVTIRQVTSVSAARLAAADTTRLQADQQLLDNTRVRTTPAVDTVLTAGGLDARPAGVLALLTDMGPVWITRINVAGAERAAGRPARSLDLRTDNPAALRRQLTALTGAYGVASVHQTSDGTLRATWPVDVTPVSQPN